MQLLRLELEDIGVPGIGFLLVVELLADEADLLGLLAEGSDSENGGDGARAVLERRSGHVVVRCGMQGCTSAW